jgi:hypothetical protein
VLEQHGLEDLGLKLHRMSVAGQWQDMAKEISDDVLHLFAAVGRHDTIASAIEQRFGGISDAIGETLPPGHEPGLPPDLIAQLQRLPRRFRGYSVQCDAP